MNTKTYLNFRTEWHLILSAHHPWVLYVRDELKLGVRHSSCASCTGSRSPNAKG